MIQFDQYFSDGLKPPTSFIGFRCEFWMIPEYPTWMQQKQLGTFGEVIGDFLILFKKTCLESSLRIMGSQNHWFGDPRPLLYTSKPLYSRVQWFLGFLESWDILHMSRCLQREKLWSKLRCRLGEYLAVGGDSWNLSPTNRIMHTYQTFKHKTKRGVYRKYPWDPWDWYVYLPTWKPINLSQM